jgi:hypothetical protein
MHVKHFEDLEIWKEARRLTKEIYRITSGQKFLKEFIFAARSKAQQFPSCQI